MSRCRGCGAEIIWIKTVGGRAMPCDPGPVLYRELRTGGMKIMTRDGRVLRAQMCNDEDKADGIGYISHFSTCPEAEKFRRRTCD